MLAEAVSKGMDEIGGNASAAPISGPPNAQTQIIADMPQKPRAIIRTDADYEYEHVEKNTNLADENGIGRDEGREKRPKSKS